MDGRLPSDGLRLPLLVRDDSELELSLVRVAAPAPAADEVVVPVEATPINPSDIGLLFAAADFASVDVVLNPQETRTVFAWRTATYGQRRARDGS
jgi:hypothetical protein